MPASSQSVFVSYARRDGRSIARSLREQLDASGFDLWQDVVDMEAGETWWLQITEAIDSSAVMVLVLTDAALGSEVVREEWSYARRVGTPVIPVVVDAGLLDIAPRWLRKVDVVVLDEGHPDHELANERFLRLLRDPPPRRPRPFTAPELPRTFVPREAEFEALVSRLLDPERQNPVAVTTAIQGSGGFGKTTLALAVCHDERVRSAFDDGILWLQLRQHMTQADALTLLNEQVALLDPEGPAFSEVVLAAGRLRELLEGRDILVVLDDVWDETLVAHVVQGGSAYLITTRVMEVVARANAVPVVVDELEPSQAGELLAHWLQHPASADDGDRLRRLASRLGNWALLLELVGAELRALMTNGRTLSEAVEHVELRLTRRGFAYLDRNVPEHRNAAITQSLEASLEILPVDQRERFRELGILAADESLPFETIRQLWAATARYDELDTDDALEAMQRLALFTRYDARRRTVRLHDVIRSVIAGGLTDAPLLHAALLDHWRDPYALPDRYAWTHLVHHLREAGRGDAIRPLLLDFEWMHAKLSATDPVALVSDYAAEPNDADLRLLASVLRMAGTSLADAAQLPAQLVGRLGRLAGSSAAINNLVANARAGRDPALEPVRVYLASVDQGVHRTIRSQSPIVTAALSPEDDLLLAGLADGTVQVWDWRREKLVQTLPCGVGPVTSLAVEGELLGVGGLHDPGQSDPPSAPVEVWSWRSGTRSGALGGDLAGIDSGFRTHLRGRLAAVTTGAMDNLVHIYDWASGEPAGVVNPDEVEFGGAGNRPGAVTTAWPYLLYHENSGNRIYVWSIPERAFRDLIAGEVGLDAVAFVLDGRLVVRSRRLTRRESEDPFFYRLGDDSGWAPVESPSTDPLDVLHYDPPVTAIAQCDGRVYVCTQNINVIDAATGEAVARLEGHSSAIGSVDVLDDVIVTTSYDRTIRVWDRETRVRSDAPEHGPREAATAPLRQPTITCLAVDGSSAFVGTEAGEVQEWDWQTGSLQTRTEVGEPVRALDANDRWLVFSHFAKAKWARFHARPRTDWHPVGEAGEWRRTRTFAVRQGEFDFGDRGVTMARLCGNVCAVVLQNYYTPANSLGMGTYTGDELLVVDLAAEEAEFDGGQWISAVAISEQFIVGGSIDGQIEVWNRASGDSIVALRDHSGPITSLALHDEHLISSSLDTTVKVWSLDAFRPTATIPHDGGVRSMRLHAGLLLTASDDHMLRLFDWRDGRALARFTDDAALLACGIAGGATSFIAGGMSGQVHILRPNPAMAERLTPQS